MSFPTSVLEWQAPLPPIATSAPPMLSPTSVPRPSKAVPERRPKLRASCDACAASKVKCSKEHPVCLRCATNDMQCVYGISRKHGKPGRTRKRNPDGSPFIKASKQRPSPDGSEFGKFRIRQEPQPTALPDFSGFETPSWSAATTPEWPSTPEFDYQMTPNTNYQSDFSFMDDILMSGDDTYIQDTSPMEVLGGLGLTFKDPFANKESNPMHLDFSLSSNFQPFRDFPGGDFLGPIASACSDPSTSYSLPACTPPVSPKGTGSQSSVLSTNIDMPSSHCCYTLAYTTLESLNPGTQIEVFHSLDYVLNITKLAMQNVLQLLNCKCASDPHLAMLYSSITSKMLTWYQIAAGISPTSHSPITAPPSTPALSDCSTSSPFFSPLVSPSSPNALFSIRPAPLKIGAFEFDAADQEALRRQVVLRELKKCGALVEALANWRRKSVEGALDGEQAEFLYDVLGAWLKSALYKTVQELTGED
jgi:hypothetical protein